MGRLFWKFFLLFWLAQVITTITVGVVIWADHHPPHSKGSFFLGPAPPMGAPPSESPWTNERPAAFRPPPPPPRFPIPLLPILVGGVVSLMFAALLAWYFSKPIRHLRDAFKSVSSGQLETRIADTMGQRRDELADLGQDFDQMAGRLENLVGSQRRLFHDVSHELRSPLARLQAAADLARQQPERMAEFVERIERDTCRMDTLVGELLTLARLEVQIVEHLEEVCDVREVLIGIANDAELEAERKHCNIELNVPASIFVRGSQELLCRAFENIVRNAVRYTQANGQVTISSCVENDGVKISIADTGPGVIDLELHTIFEPFVRAKAELFHTGYGLGLAMTKRVVESHGGSVRARHGKTQGLVVEVMLPLLGAVHQSGLKRS